MCVGSEMAPCHEIIQVRTNEMKFCGVAMPDAEDVTWQVCKQMMEMQYKFISRNIWGLPDEGWFC